MRFNQKELSCIACQSQEKFDKEGVLLVKERQDGLFRKGEAYVERLFRLRGNLLFYFKTKDVNSEVLGVVVLERCLVELSDDDPSLHSFNIVFEGDEHEQMRLATRVESERDGWIERLHIAGYECMRIQLDSLREQVKARTGRDPVESGCLALDGLGARSECANVISSHTEDPKFEMCLSCRDLPEEAEGRAPDTYAVVSFLLAAGDRWETHSHTEIVEKSCNPLYMTTFGFNSPITTSTRIRVIVYSVKERLTKTMTPIGHALFTLSSVLSSVNSSLIQRLNSLDGSNVGSLYIMTWENEYSEPSPPLSEMPMQESIRVKGSSVISRGRNLSLASEHRRRGIDLLKDDYANVVTKTFRFPVGSGVSGACAGNDHLLIVHEYMAESRLTFSFPIQLLKLLIEEERCKINQLDALGSLTEETSSLRQQKVDLHFSTLMLYQQHVSFHRSFSGTFMKPSAKKAHKEVEFAPTNLHLQRMTVCHTASTNPSYDIITVGIFTAGAQKYKQGGLRRMLQRSCGSADGVANGIQYDGQLAGQKPAATLSITIAEALSKVDQLHKLVTTLCDRICDAAVLGDTVALGLSSSRLAEQTKQLIEVCESDVVNRGVKYCSLERAAISAQLVIRNSGTAVQTTELPSKGAGASSVASEETWDLAKFNSQSALMCVISKVDELTSQMFDQDIQWFDHLNPLVSSLKSCIQAMCSLAVDGLSFLSVKECASNVVANHAITYRRDVVFSQAITSATTGFITKLKSNLDNDMFLHQLVEVGLLMQFESLISCYGDEMGMLEDLDVAMQDLANVQFKIEEMASPDEDTVKLSGSRYSYTVVVRLKDIQFNHLSSELRGGKLIKLVPILFSIGINEQATFAERLGDISLQDIINNENYKRLYSYYEIYMEFIAKQESSMKLDIAVKLEPLMRHLQVAVTAHKAKNVDVLTIAGEICVAMNGMRFTGCKSAKDRTAMSVTLEQVRILQHEYNLATDYFLHALECFRSEGVRRENTYKNTGVYKYAFNSIQMLYLPKLYRPPAGTYGNTET